MSSFSGTTTKIGFRDRPNPVAGQSKEEKNKDVSHTVTSGGRASPQSPEHRHAVKSDEREEMFSDEVRPEGQF